MNTPRRRQRFLIEVVRLVEAKILSVTEKILDILAGGVDFVSFEDL